MAKNQTYRSFIARPSHVLDLNGELLDSAPVSTSLASEIRDISAYATYVVRNDGALGDELRALLRRLLLKLVARRAWLCLIFWQLESLVGRVKKNCSNTTL